MIVACCRCRVRGCRVGRRCFRGELLLLLSLDSFDELRFGGGSEVGDDAAPPLGSVGTEGSRACATLLSFSSTSRPSMASSAAVLPYRAVMAVIRWDALPN